MAGFLEKARSRLGQMLTGEQPTLESVEDQSADDIATAAMVKGFIEEVRSHPARIANEAIWMTNIAYLLGFDSLHFDSSNRQFRPMGNQLTKDRIHVNKILPTCQNRLARLCKNPPKFDVRPNSNEQDDKDAAELAMKVILNYWDKCHVNDKRIDLKMWCQQTGIGYLKVSWDASAGRYMQGPDGELVPEGDLAVEVASPFECFPDVQAKRFDEVQKFAQAKIRTLAYFPTQYPERGNLVKEEGCWLNSLAFDAQINTSTNSTGAASSPDKAIKNSAIEMSYYEAPSAKHRRGRHVIVANGVVLKNGALPASELPNEPAIIPFSKFDDIRIGGKYTSEAVITHMRPVQDQLNRTLNQRARWTNRLLAGKYIAPRGANLKDDAFNDQSGEIVEYDIVPNAVNSGEPHALSMPNLPQSAYLEEERMNEALNDICGINEVSRGQLPSAGMPAIGMQFLVEQDDTRIGIMTESDEYAYARVGRLILKFTQCYITTERLLKTGGGGNQRYIVKKFKGEDIRMNDDVIVIRGSTLPGSKVLKRQEIINTYVQGLLGDPADPRVRQKVLGMLEYGDTAEAWLDDALAKHQIQKGLKLIEEGRKPIIDEQDNHVLWVQELNRYRIGDKFEKLSDESQVIFLQVREEHLQMQMKLENPQLEDEEIPEESSSAQDAAGALGVGPADEAAFKEPPPESGLEAAPQPQPQEQML